MFCLLLSLFSGEGEVLSLYFFLPSFLLLF